MVGYGPNKGIVPICVEEIFKRIESNDNEKKSYEVTFSMLEIYSERVQDLLVNIDDRPKGGLKVRQHKKFGVYVQGLGKHPVDSYEMIEDLMEKGNINRTTA